MYSRKRTFAVGPKDKAGGCSYEKVWIGRCSVISAKAVGEKQWEKGQMEREDQRQSKAMGILEPP